MVGRGSPFLLGFRSVPADTMRNSGGGSSHRNPFGLWAQPKLDATTHSPTTIRMSMSTLAPLA